MFLPYENMQPEGKTEPTVWLFVFVVVVVIVYVTAACVKANMSLHTGDSGQALRTVQASENVWGQIN